MARKQSDHLFDVLRAHGLRKRVAKTIAELDGSGRGAGSKGEKLARRGVEAARHTASARKRAAARRSATARKGPHIRARSR
jgi:hypothetical protein